jgi:hypothetical protein
VAEIPATVVDKATWVDLRELDDHGEFLTEFEIAFVENLTKQLRIGREATEKQRATLAQIREERLP